MAILEMKNIYKAFGGAKALSDVHLTVERGEIHALLGENGAGKSTLMNILTGVVAMDGGTILFDGKHYPMPTIQMMESAGIAFVHQELNVINDLTVFENIFLHREITKFGTLQKKEMIHRTEQLFNDLGVNIDPKQMVSELKTSQKQLLEICRALYADAKLLIMDEPTTALNNDEIAHLFGILKQLKARGKTFIFISHKMPEIFEIADRYTIFRNGSFVCEGYIKDTDPIEVTTNMVGERYVNEDIYLQREHGQEVLRLENLSGEGFSNVSFQIKKGEIVALTGLAGSGAGELMQTMFGVIPKKSGNIFIHNKVIDGNIVKFMKNGVAMLPANRKENSVVPDISILENFYLAEHSLSRRKQFIRQKQETARYEENKQLLSIKAPSYTESINSLSGGNQQKVFLARWLNIGADILLLDNPTQGVDVGAKAEIYKLILKFAENGKTVLINTTEIPEIMKVADRCLVFYEGKIVKSFPHDEINEHSIMLYSTNAAEVVS